MSRLERLAVLTTARSDFGPLHRVISEASQLFTTDVLMAGSHFAADGEASRNEVRNAIGTMRSVRLVELKTQFASGSPAEQAQSLADMQTSAAQWFALNQCDALLFLGDRWELFGVTLPALLAGVPLAHISGGEITEGAIDDAIRHAHTKLAHLHFAANRQFAETISRMGEEDWRISISGECGLDQLHHCVMADASELRNQFDIDLTKKTILVTLHPSTLDYQTPIFKQIEAVLQALESFTDYQLIFTGPGEEQGSEEITQAITNFVSRHEYSRFVSHFGSRFYLTVLHAAEAVIGNSSSGLLEAPTARVPSINIGYRQKNRPAAKSVRHVGYDPSEIRDLLRSVIQERVEAEPSHYLNPYDPYLDGRNSQRIVKSLKSILRKVTRARLLVKKFELNVDPAAWNKYMPEFR